MARKSSGSASSPRLPPLQPAVNHTADFAAADTPSLSTPFKLDEGYSDETKTQVEKKDLAIPASDEWMTLQEWVLTHSEAERAGKFSNGLFPIPRPAGCLTTVLGPWRSPSHTNQS